MPIISIERAVVLLHNAKLVAFPTETVYGLGADASNASAIQKIFQLKRRPSNHPIIVHLADKDDIQAWAAVVPAEAWALLEHFTPGPLTLIFKKKPQVLKAVTGGQDTIGIRIPSHPVAQKLLRHFGKGIAAPSANRFGHISPTSAAHVRAEFGDNINIIDGGLSDIGLESTIVDVSSLHHKGEARLLRPGHISQEVLEKILGNISYNAVATQQKQKIAKLQPIPRASGMLKRHYAPRTPCFLIANFSHINTNDAVISYQMLPEEITPKITRGAWLQLPDNPRGYAQKLYASLRQLDALEPARILIQSPPHNKAWAAICDRLERASQGILI